MNQDPRAAGRPRTPKSGSGSVRAARQRAEAEVPSGIPRPVTPKSSAAAKGMAISRPAPMPQWPLVGAPEDGGASRGRSPRNNNSPRKISPPSERMDSRGSPPRRPARPSYVPSILDGSKIQDHAPAFQYTQQQDGQPYEQYRQPQQQPHPQYRQPQQQQQQQQQQRQRQLVPPQLQQQQQQRPRQQQQQQQQQQYVQQPQPRLRPGQGQQPQVQQPQQARYWEQAHLSPADPGTPGAALSGASNSSRPSTTSSFGSIPDFPVPMVPSVPSPSQVQPRRSIGPPPTARRGASSYYSQSSYVAPIPEESAEMPKRRQKDSYASSHVIPQSWSDGPPGYYMDNYHEEEEEEEGAEGMDGRISRESRSTEADESTGLVRKISVGKQFKPTLTTVHSNNDSPISPKSAVAQAAFAVGATGGAFAAGFGQSEDRRGDLEEGDIVLGHQPDTMNGSAFASAPNTGASTPSSLHGDPRVRQILGGLERGGALDSAAVPSVPDLQSETDAISPAPRQPLRLDIDAVRDAEQRGSLTSLPDLIRRATKVASNLDKGRTASRLGMLDMFGSQPDLLDKVKAANAAHAADNPRNSSISGMLASFPPPALTPSGDRPTSRWPSPFNNSNLHLNPPLSPLKHEGDYEPTRRRRCCGMPAWVFVLLLLTLLCVIAAAVVIPVVLIVLPRQNAATTTTVNLSNCPASNPCANGGTSVVSQNSCRCVCANGYTGSLCSTRPDVDCTSTTVGAFSGATLGSSLPRLISGASANFSVPLNTTALLSALSASNLTCSDENSLVTFNGASQRRSVTLKRNIPSEPRSGPPAAVTSNGIVLAPPSTPTAVTVTGTAVSSATSSPTASSSSSPSSFPDPSSGSSRDSPSQNDLDFARVALLLILQDAGFDAAVDAQTTLKAKLTPGSFAAASVSVGNGIEVDLLRQRVSLNGTVVGG